ncbi:MAG: ATP-binding cassette domain-containing protein [Escherichia coli]
MPSPAAHRMGVVHQHPLGLRRGCRRRQYRRAADGDRGTSLAYSCRAEVAGRGGNSRQDRHATTFSGGMQQRLQIARNLVTHPKLVFMDEPTGGLDVSVQARLLDLLRGLVVELNLAVVIVTHDLGVARLLADRLLVMKQGQVVESGLTDRVLDDPHHPYTQLLVSSVLQN